MFLEAISKVNNSTSSKTHEIEILFSSDMTVSYQRYRRTRLNSACSIQERCRDTSAGTVNIVTVIWEPSFTNIPKFIDFS